jgi:hypothetical protein
MNPRPN